MRHQTTPRKPERLKLKQPTGWFAAGVGFHKAMALLSDGAFKLFVYLCLQADRSTGCLQTSHKQLAQALGKSKRALITYVTELQEKGVCEVCRGRNQYAPTRFQICDTYWPYQRVERNGQAQDCSANQAFQQRAYVAALKDLYLGIGCGPGKFGPAEVTVAKAFSQRGIPLLVVQDAMLLAACRKYLSWLNGSKTAPIGSLRYFEPLIEEISRQPLPEGYREYLREKNEQLAKMWEESAESQKQFQKEGYPGTACSEIVQ